MRLIVSEKDNAARRIADILSDGTASADRRGGVNVYSWGGNRVIGLSGHVVGVDFPDEYANWNKVDPSALVGAEIVKTPTREDIVNSLKRLARRADHVTIATDYDREGELIGKEAYELIREVNEDVPIDRVRFSSITEREVKSAFEEPDDLDFDLAAAGEARQIIDLMWGAALTRYLSLAAKQYGDDFISVGRVQSPTLKLLVDREREIEAFEPEDYWELFADLLKAGEDEPFEAQYYYLDEDDNEAERVWSEADAEAIFGVLEGTQVAAVEEVERRTRTDRPPAPFNTTQFIRAAGAIGFSAKRAMSIAEDLYTAGYITYPRTDNTVYPDDLDPAELLAAFARTVAFGDDARDLLEGDLTPTRGEEETTDHPPIHPTADFPRKDDLSDAEWRVYELVVRRFFATLAEPAVWEHLRVVVDADGLSLKANGKRLVEPGYHAVYPYFSTDENYVPDVTEGEELAVEATRLEAKQTQPPRRFGQSRLIETMEEMGIGTKCLTGDVPVLVRDARGDVVRRSARDLFDEGRVLMADGEVDVAVSDRGPTTVSFDERLERLTERRGSLVSARPLEPTENVLTIVTATGSFSVTDDHPLYLRDGDTVTIRPANAVTPGDRLLSARPGGQVVDPEELPVAATFEEFTAARDGSMNVDAGEVGETRVRVTDRFATDQTSTERRGSGPRTPSVELPGVVDASPSGPRDANVDRPIEDVFPVEWSPELARLLGSVLARGHTHLADDEDVVAIESHDVDRRLVDRFTADLQSLFEVTPQITERPAREEHRGAAYQVRLPPAVGQVLAYLRRKVTRGDRPAVPAPLIPSFVGALFDEVGHISTDVDAVISTTDHDLLTGIGAILDGLGIDATLEQDRHRLRIRGRANLERFLDRIPIAADEPFYRALAALDEDDASRQKALVLDRTRHVPRTAAQLAADLGTSRARVHELVGELRTEGYLKPNGGPRHRRHGGLRTRLYEATGFEESIYATLLGRPASVPVLDVRARAYDGPVYDLSIDETSPNFAVAGGAIVHNSTRHETIDKLYDRGYVEDDPPRPTQLARGVVEAAEEYADQVVTETMTAELEADMAAIAQGEKTLDEVTDESREMLREVFSALEGAEEAIGEHIREALKRDKALGPCPSCGERLLVRKSRYGSHFVGCEGYPDCEYTLPLPNRGTPQVLAETCEEHGLRHVKMLAGRSTFVHGCPQCKADEADAEEDRVIGACPECGEAEGGELAIKRVRSGSRLVGCTRYPDCEYSLPLPRRGDLEITTATCEEHDLPELVIHSGDEPWELGCPICNFREYQQERANDLESVKGIGKKTAKKLEDAGIATVDDLKEADPDEVAGSVDGVSASQVRTWKTDARA